MIPGVNVIGGKVSVESVNGAGWSGVFCDLTRGFSGQSTLRKFLGSKEHIDWLKIDLNAAELITVQNYKYKKENNVNGSKYTQC